MKQLHWIRVDCHTPDHPKVRRLERMVGDAALAYLVRLWAKAATYSPDGDLSGFEVEEIEDWARWPGDAGALVDALVACGFIDDGDTVQLHGWEERQAERSRVRAAGAERARRFRRKVASSTQPQDKESGITPPPAEPEQRNAGSVTPVTPLPVTPTDGRTDETNGRTKDVSAETGQPVSTPAAASPPLLVFPTYGKAREWPLSREQVDEWAAIYPSLDVLAECRGALAWVRANSGRRKTPGGMTRFLVGWLNRATNGRRIAAAPLADTRRNPHPLHPDTQAFFDRTESDAAEGRTVQYGRDRSRGAA